jgi:hypothetical protein
MSEKYSTIVTDLSEPAIGAFEVTSSGVDLDIFPRALYVGGTGDVVVKTINDETVTFKAVPVGTFLPIRVKQVSGTSTATYIVGLY